MKRVCIVSKTPSVALPPFADKCKAGTDTDHDGIADLCDEDPSIPDSCTLRVARSRVFVYSSQPKVRLVVKCKTRTPAQVKTTYTETLANGKKLGLGSVKKSFGAEGTVKLPVALNDGAAEKVRKAKSFTVGFSIPGAPKACSRAYTKQLTKKGHRRQADGLVPIGPFAGARFVLSPRYLLNAFRKRARVSLPDPLR